MILDPVPNGMKRTLLNDPHLRWSGRVLFEGCSAYFDWPGVSLTFRFSGSAFMLELTDSNNDYDLTIDGSLFEVWRTLDGETLKVVEGLAEGEHEVRLVKRTEASWGEATMRGILLRERDQILQGPDPLRRRIEFIGDSLVCGYGVEGNDPLCHGCRSLENVGVSYAGLISKKLDVDAHFIAISGKGLIRNWAEPQDRSADPLPLYYGRTLAGRAGHPWEFRPWVPQLVVLQLGSNDFSTHPQPRPADWVKAYIDLANTVMCRYPDAGLLCIGRPQVPPLGECLEQVFVRLKAEGRFPARLVQWKKFKLSEMGCDYHPNQVAQRGMAEQVLPFVRDLTGWD